MLQIFVQYLTFRSSARFESFMAINRSRSISVRVLSGYGMDYRCSIPARATNLFQPLVLRLTQPPVQWYRRVKCGQGVTLTTSA